jgi:hypothetical protein
MNVRNDPHFPSYNENEPEKRILYLDANNLYGWAMSQLLPVGDYVWEKESDTLPDMVQLVGEHDSSIWFEDDMTMITHYILEKLKPDGPYGWIFEVDLDCPPYLHDYFNDYPLCPSRKRVSPSSYTIHLAEKLGLHILKEKDKMVGQEKLILDLLPKYEYVIHFRNLQQCLGLGMTLKKVHRVIRFQQKPWLKAYIDMNTERRKQAKDNVAKDFFKLMNNAIFGKTMEQVRKRRKVEFFIGKKSIHHALKVIAGPYIKAERVIEDDAILALEKYYTQMVMNRPMILGMSILDLSKLHMYHFHYDVMLPHFGLDRVQLSYTDTDSLVYLLTALKGSTVYEELRQLQEKYDCFDLSEISDPSHPLLEGQDKMKNAKVLGKFKDELFGVPLLQFIALRPKMYSMVDDSGKEKARRKGIPHIVSLHHQDYQKAFIMGKGEDVSFLRIDHNKKFELQTVECAKRGLNACDDKSYYLNAFECVRYGHYSITKNT